MNDRRARYRLWLQFTAAISIAVFLLLLGTVGAETSTPERILLLPVSIALCLLATWQLPLIRPAWKGLAANLLITGALDLTWIIWIAIAGGDVGLGLIFGALFFMVYAPATAAITFLYALLTKRTSPPAR